MIGNKQLQKSKSTEENYHYIFTKEFLWFKEIHKEANEKLHGVLAYFDGKIKDFDKNIKNIKGNIIDALQFADINYCDEKGNTFLTHLLEKKEELGKKYKEPIKDIVKFLVAQGATCDEKLRKKLNEIVPEKEQDKVKEAFQEKAKKTLKEHFQNDIKEVSRCGNHLQVKLAGKQKFQISELSKSDFFTGNGIAKISVQDEDGNSGLHCLIYGGIRHYSVTNNCSYEMILDWPLSDGRMDKIKIYTNADGTVEVDKDYLRAYEEGKIDVGANKEVRLGNFSLAEALANGRWKGISQASEKVVNIPRTTSMERIATTPPSQKINSQVDYQQAARSSTQTPQPQKIDLQAVRTSTPVSNGVAPSSPGISPIPYNDGRSQEDHVQRSPVKPVGAGVATNPADAVDGWPTQQPSGQQQPVQQNTGKTKGQQQQNILPPDTFPIDTWDGSKPSQNPQEAQGTGTQTTTASTSAAKKIPPPPPKRISSLIKTPVNEQPNQQQDAGNTSRRLDEHSGFSLRKSVSLDGINKDARKPSHSSAELENRKAILGDIESKSKPLYNFLKARGEKDDSSTVGGNELSELLETDQQQQHVAQPEIARASSLPNLAHTQLSQNGQSTITDNQQQQSIVQPEIAPTENAAKNIPPPPPLMVSSLNKTPINEQPNQQQDARNMFETTSTSSKIGWGIKPGSLRKLLESRQKDDFETIDESGELFKQLKEDKDRLSNLGTGNHKPKHVGGHADRGIHSAGR